MRVDEEYSTKGLKTQTQLERQPKNGTTDTVIISSKNTSSSIYRPDLQNKLGISHC